MMALVSRNSRYLFGEAKIIEGFEFWDILDLPDIPVQPDDQRHTVKGSDVIDMLAQIYYQDSGLWWVIAQANNLDVLPTDLRPGLELRIPSPRYISQEHFNRRSSRRRGRGIDALR